MVECLHDLLLLVALLVLLLVLHDLPLLVLLSDEWLNVTMMHQRSYDDGKELPRYGSECLAAFGNGGTLYLSVNTSYFRTRHSDGDDDEAIFAQIQESSITSSKVETKNGFKFKQNHLSKIIFFLKIFI